MKKSGFVLMETVVVILVLCVVLIALYASYSKVLITVNKKSLFDNSEYIYKTEVIRKYLEERVNPNVYNSSLYYIYCSNFVEANKCINENVSNNYENDLFKFLGVEAIYIMLCNVAEINENDLSGFEATTQNYIKTLDPSDENAFRIIVMFKSENNETNKPLYEYASLRFGSRR